MAKHRTSFRTEPLGTTPDPSWVKIADRQMVGTARYCAVYRDLYETPDGGRVSIPVSEVFELPSRDSRENQVHRGAPPDAHHLPPSERLKS